MKGYAHGASRTPQKDLTQPEDVRGHLNVQLEDEEESSRELEEVGTVEH